MQYVWHFWGILFGIFGVGWLYCLPNCLVFLWRFAEACAIFAIAK